MAKQKSANFKAKSKGKTKLAAKPLPKVKKSATRRAVQVEALDRVLLKMAAQPYDKILKQIEVGKKKLDEERRLALQVGNRILTKAKEVRDSLIRVSRSRKKK